MNALKKYSLLILFFVCVLGLNKTYAQASTTDEMLQKLYKEANDGKELSLIEIHSMIETTQEHFDTWQSVLAYHKANPTISDQKSMALLKDMVDGMEEKVKVLE